MQNYQIDSRPIQVRLAVVSCWCLFDRGAFLTLVDGNGQFLCFCLCEGIPKNKFGVWRM